MAKKIILIVFVVIIWVCASAYFKSNHDIELEKIHNRLDSIENAMQHLKRNQDTIKFDVKNLRLDADTLKRGQSVIFNEVRRAADRSFWDFLR